MGPPDATLTCHFCGQIHRAARLEPGEKARCVRCDTLLAHGPRLGRDAPLVFAVTGLALALPSALLPFVTAGKLGDHQSCKLFTGVAAMWGDGMRAMAVLVLVCGGLMPIALLASIAVRNLPDRFRALRQNVRPALRLIRPLEHWAIPEVQVLAVLVALVKLHSVVNLQVGPGFWSYCAMTVALLVAQNSSEYDSDPADNASGEPAPASS